MGERLSVRAVRIGATLYFVLFALFVMWPVFTPFNHPLPLVFGLPFNMAMIALWVAFGSVVLFVLDRSEERYRAGDDRAAGEARPPAGRQDRPTSGGGEG